MAERIYQKSNNPPTTATYQYHDLALIGVVVEYPTAEKSGSCVLLSCTDKHSHHEGGSEQCIRKCMLKDDRSAKEGERIRNHFSYKLTLFHESKLPRATDAQICFSWPFKWCYCVDILLHGVNCNACGVLTRPAAFMIVENRGCWWWEIRSCTCVDT